jgi:hypothetical protein
MTENILLKTSLPEGIYTIQDNGLRCFVPPCFSWNVLDKDGQLITTVSDIDISSLEGFFDLKIIQASLANKGLLVRGHSILLPESDGVRQAVGFVVDGLEGLLQ